MNWKRFWVRPDDGGGPREGAYWASCWRLTVQVCTRERAKQLAPTAPWYLPRLVLKQLTITKCSERCRLCAHTTSTTRNWTSWETGSLKLVCSWVFICTMTLDFHILLKFKKKGVCVRVGGASYVIKTGKRGGLPKWPGRGKEVWLSLGHLEITVFQNENQEDSFLWRRLLSIVLIFK